MGAELARGDAMLGVHAIERAHELVLHGATTHGHGAQREQAGRDREQRAELRRAILARRAGLASTSGRGLDEIGKRVFQLRLGAADPLGARAAVGDQLRDGPREPRRIVLGDDARADEHEQ